MYYCLPPQDNDQLQSLSIQLLPELLPRLFDLDTEQFASLRRSNSWLCPGLEFVEDSDQQAFKLSLTTAYITTNNNQASGEREREGDGWVADGGFPGGW